MKRTTAGMFLSTGAMAAAAALGLDAVGIASVMGDGLAQALSQSPLADTGRALDGYFKGACDWTAGISIALHEWLLGAGAEVSDRTRQTVLEMRIWLGDKADEAQDFFSDIIRSGIEAGAAWAASARNAVLDDPGAAFTNAGKVLATTVEAWGVFKGLQEAYRWAVGKFSDASEPETSRSEVPGPQTITNIHINLALSNAGDIPAAMEGLISTINGSDRRVEITGQMRDALEKDAPADPDPADDDLTLEEDQGESEPGQDEAENELASDDEFDFASLFAEEELIGSRPLIDERDIIWVGEEFSRTFEQALRQTMGPCVKADVLEAISNDSRARIIPKNHLRASAAIILDPQGSLMTMRPTPLAANDLRFN